MSSHFDSIAALLNLAANCSIDWPNRPCKSDRHRFQLWSNHNLLRSVASSKYPCGGKTDDVVAPEHGSTRLRIERKDNLFTASTGSGDGKLTSFSSTTVIMDGSDRKSTRLNSSHRC